jgi:hypothetical protein
MSTDLDKLLDDASSDPTTPIDPDELWAAGRRRRWIRRAGATGGTAVLVAAVALVGLNLTGPTTTPDIAPLGQPTAEQEPQGAEPLVEADAEAEAEAEAEAAADAEAARVAARERALEVRERLDQERLAREQAEQQRAEAEAQAAQEAEAEAEAEPRTAPTPSASALAAPCAAHEGRDMDVFIDVVGPVSGQQVGPSFELVGCANVFEATVRYRLLGGGGVLRDSFTTATCGTGCVGEFRETVQVPAGSGSLTLEVFWDSPKDGSEQDKVTIPLERG